jgi:formylglycine-generating enzyme required for sulfatase activity
LSCHAIADLHRAPLANGSYRVEPPAPPWGGALGAALVAADLDAHRRTLGRPLLRDPALCGSCHQQHLPQLRDPTDAQLEQQYAEWRRSPYADPAHPDAKDCVDCHMPLVEAEDPAATAGKVRSHRMPGANHAHATKAGHPAQAAAVLETLRAGLRLELAPRLDPAAGVLDVAVTLHNEGAGHRFPSGATDISEAWVEVVVGDPEAPVAAVGRLGPDHTLDADTPIWRRVLLDDNGLVVDLHDLLAVRSVLEDRSVPPKGSDTVRHRLALPPDLSGSVSVRARLQLRKANQRWNGWLFNFDGRTTPVLTIHEETVTVVLPEGWAEGLVAAAAPARLVAPLPAAPPGMVAIPGGLFRMGVSDGEPDEGPVHGRRMRAFAIDRTPVTAGEAAAALRGKGRAPPRLLLPWAERWSWTSAGPPPGTEGAPAILLTREEAEMVCAARGARLPTEAEWELAARGYEGRRYPWGDDPTPPACPAVDGVDVPPAVGLCPGRASPFGVLDMVGGVLEWTADGYLAYPDPLLDNNANEWVVTFAPDMAAVRGSPAGRRGPATSAAARTGQNPYQRGRVGFRCARSLEG